MTRHPTRYCSTPTTACGRIARHVVTGKDEAATQWFACDMHRYTPGGLHNEDIESWFARLYAKLESDPRQLDNKNFAEYMRRRRGAEYEHTEANAMWCPICGNCSCPKDETGDCALVLPTCALHGGPEYSLHPR